MLITEPASSPILPSVIILLAVCLTAPLLVALCLRCREAERPGHTRRALIREKRRQTKQWLQKGDLAPGKAPNTVPTKLEDLANGRKSRRQTGGIKAIAPAAIQVITKDQQEKRTADAESQIRKPISQPTQHTPYIRKSASQPTNHTPNDLMTIHHMLQSPLRASIIRRMSRVEPYEPPMFYPSPQTLYPHLLHIPLPQPHQMSTSRGVSPGQYHQQPTTETQSYFTAYTGPPQPKVTNEPVGDRIVDRRVLSESEPTRALDIMISKNEPKGTESDNIDSNDEHLVGLYEYAAFTVRRRYILGTPPGSDENLALAPPEHRRKRKHRASDLTTVVKTGPSPTEDEHAVRRKESATTRDGGRGVRWGRRRKSKSEPTNPQGLNNIPNTISLQQDDVLQAHTRDRQRKRVPRSPTCDH